MKSLITVVFWTIISLLAGCSMPLKMPPPSTLELVNVHQHSYTAGLFVPQSLKEYVHEQATSPLDKISYPLGNQTNESFKKNLPLVFKDIVEVSSITPAQDVDITIKPSIVKFESIIPHPAYKPYTATIVYHIDIFNKAGEKIFTQTATGEAQTSKGLMSGFSARSICAEVAQMAIDDAIQQLIEGISETDELKNFN